MPAPSGLTEVTLEDGSRIFSTDRLEGHVGAVVYPWEVAVAREAPVDSAQNHVRGPIASIVPVANRVRVRIGPLTAEITAASAERLGLRLASPSSRASRRPEPDSCRCRSRYSRLPRNKRTK